MCKALYKKLICAFSLEDYKDKISKLPEPNKKIFIESYFKILGQLVYGLNWIDLTVVILFSTFIFGYNIMRNIYDIIAFCLFFTLVIVIFRRQYNSDIKEDLDELIKILEKNQKKRKKTTIK